MAEEKNQIIINSESDAFAALKRALDKEFEGQPVAISFKGWPVLQIKLEGEGYKSTITPDMAEAIVSLQHAINRTYARVVKNETTARSLTEVERRKLLFKAKVEEGSSLIEVNLGQVFEKIGQELVQKMDPTMITVTILGLAVVGGSTLAYRSFLKHKADGKALEEEAKKAVALSEQETKRLEIVSQALAQRPVLDLARQDFDEVRQDILGGTADAKRLTVQGVPISGQDARAIARTPKSETRAVQLNGHYAIRKIDWDHEDVARLSLESTDNQRRFTATLKIDEIDARQRELLKEAEWNRSKVYMSINGTELRGEITTATIVGAEWPAAIEPQGANE